jgi:isopenicillin N synthase-like dioxygenase
VLPEIEKRRVTEASARAALPVIDVSGLRGDRSARARDRTAAEIAAACRDVGFFYVVGHGIDDGCIERLAASSREFFAQDLARKLEIDMSLGGLAWRGYFPVGRELTSGRPDRKEGIYFGAELSPEDPKVRARTPLHGANLFPATPPGLRAAVLDYLTALTELGHLLVRGVSRSLDLDEDELARRYTADPLILFRIFNYPVVPPGDEAVWSVGEHTDYGLLTILWQDDAGGLEVKSSGGWMEVPPLPGSFVCNLGDMLDRMTGGLYRSTPHRVRNRADRSRLSFAFFFDPAFDAEIAPIHPGRAFVDDRHERWDAASVHEFRGTYGEYLLGKVARVFPDLDRKVLRGED